MCLVVSPKPHDISLNEKRESLMNGITTSVDHDDDDQSMPTNERTLLVMLTSLLGGGKKGMIPR